MLDLVGFGAGVDDVGHGRHGRSGGMLEVGFQVKSGGDEVVLGGEVFPPRDRWRHVWGLGPEPVIDDALQAEGGAESDQGGVVVGAVEGFVGDD